MKDFFQLKKNLSKDVSGLKRLKMAVMGDTSTQFLVQALRGLAYENKLDLQIWEAEYDLIDQEILNRDSGLYSSGASYVLIFQSSQQMLNHFYSESPQDRSTWANRMMSHLQMLHRQITQGMNARVICFNYAEIDDAVFGNFANRFSASFLYQIRLLNVELMKYAGQHADFLVCDLSSLQNRLGREKMFQASLYVNAGMILSVDVLPHVAGRVLDLIQALEGRFRKCLILDLDNTLWGGIAGDDGPEHLQIGHLGIGKAFSDFQHWIKALKNRGILLAVCSKNEEKTAREVFERHPDMVLRQEDFAVFIANWENKADNIRRIQQILNIGFDSMVFVDDQAFERNLVRAHLPEVCVPEMPEDPAEYTEFLRGLNLFETASWAEEDAWRTRQYQDEVRRVSFRGGFPSHEDYLASLEMKGICESFTDFNTPRLAQLSQRSNQFNLRSVRYTEADIRRLAGDPDYIGLAFSLGDQFGSHGLISMVVMKKEDDRTLFVENWLMSCRVLKRGVEDWVLNAMVQKALDKGYQNIMGEYIPGPRNAMVEKHYEQMGFTRCDSGKWMLGLHHYQSRKTFIII